MVKTIPLNAKPTLKLEAKNEAKVKATKQRLARSSNFSAYNLRWNSFISISLKSITLNYSLSRNFREDDDGFGEFGNDKKDFSLV